METVDQNREIRQQKLQTSRNIEKRITAAFVEERFKSTRFRHVALCSVVALSSLSEDSLRDGELWREINVVLLQQVTTQANVLRVLCRANVAREVPSSAAFEFYVSG